jgi:hypothetical protein
MSRLRNILLTGFSLPSAGQDTFHDTASPFPLAGLHGALDRQALTAQARRSPVPAGSVNALRFHN